MMLKQAQVLRTPEDFSHFPKNNANELTCSGLNCSCCLIKDLFLEKQISKLNNWPCESAVRLITSLMRIWLESLSNFLNGNYCKYDALVGENACQIRAAIILDLALDLLENPEKTQKFENATKVLEQNINRLSFMDISKPHRNETFKSFLHRNNLTFVISQEMVLVITSYLLTLARVTNPSDGLLLIENIDLKVIQERGLSYKEARVIIPFYQKLLSNLSCHYIRKEADILEDQNLSVLMIELIDNFGRKCLPLLAVFKVIFSRMLQKNQNILIHVERRYQNNFADQIEFFYKPNQKKTDFELSTFPSTKTPCVVIGGVVNYENEVESLETYKARFHTLRLLYVIYANGAAHPQYPSEYKNIDPLFDEALSELMKKLKEYESCNIMDRAILTKKQIEQVHYEKSFFYSMKKFAYENGLCLQNPSLFFLNHVYCDVVEGENFRYSI